MESKDAPAVVAVKEEEEEEEEDEEEDEEEVVAGVASKPPMANSVDKTSPAVPPPLLSFLSSRPGIHRSVLAKRSKSWATLFT
jgi:hypothetical protein